MSFNWLFTLHFTCIFCGVLILASTARNSTKTQQNSGSYYIVLNRIIKCKNPSIPYLKNPQAVFEISAKNNTINGKLTVLGGLRHIQATMQDLYYIDGKWQVTFIARGMSCHVKFVSIIIEFLGIQYDKKTCAVPKGSYTFEFDHNKIDHLWIPLRQYGRTVRRLEMYNKSGTIACYEFESDVKPAT